MTTASMARAPLRDVALFRGIDDSALVFLAGKLSERRFPRNDIIFVQGDPGDGLYIVVEGCVGITRQNPNGDELMYNLARTGEYFGELSLIDGKPRSATATALEDTRILVLSRADFRRFLSENPAALMTCLEAVTDMLRHCTDLADELALLDVRSRLARCLLRLLDQGVLSRGGNGAGSVRITQQHLASMLGTTRESVNKQLRSLADAGTIAIRRGHVEVLDREALAECSIGFL